MIKKVNKKNKIKALAKAVNIFHFEESSPIKTKDL